jgi:hypothetical protein
LGSISIDQPLAVNILASPVSSVSDVEEQEEGEISQCGLFFNRWATIILSFSSREELNYISDSLAADWQRLTLKADSPAPSADRLPRPVTPPTKSPSHRRRGQSRQQQRIRKKKNSKRWEAASKLQALFKRYTRRVVRKVLGGSSQCYLFIKTAKKTKMKNNLEDRTVEPKPSITVARTTALDSRT